MSCVEVFSERGEGGEILVAENAGEGLFGWMTFRTW